MPSIPRGTGGCAVRMDKSIFGFQKPRSSHGAGGQTHQQVTLAASVGAVHSLSRIRLWTAARPASLSFTASQSLLKLMAIESMMPSNRLILSQPLLLLTSIFPSIRVFSIDSVICQSIGVSASVSVIPMNI